MSTFQAELLQALRERLDHLEAKRGAYALTKQALKIQRLEPHLYTEAEYETARATVTGWSASESRSLDRAEAKLELS